MVTFNKLCEIPISKRISYVYLSSFLSSPTAAEFIFVRMQQPKLLGQQELATQGTASLLGLATEFRSEKIPRNILRIASVIPRKKVLIPRHSEVYGRVNSEARNGRGNVMKKLVLQKILLQQTECFCQRNLRNKIPRVCFYFCSSEQNSLKCLLFLFHGM
jgi:hypothetical protein